MKKENEESASIYCMLLDSLKPDEKQFDKLIVIWILFTRKKIHLLILGNGDILESVAKEN
jgi:hypothetical protein